MIVNREFLARCNITKRHHQNVVVNSLHITVGFAGMIDVMRAIPASAPIQTPSAIDFANAQPPASPASPGFGVRDFFPCILRDFLAAS